MGEMPTEEEDFFGRIFTYAPFIQTNFLLNYLCIEILMQEPSCIKNSKTTESNFCWGEVCQENLEHLLNKCDKADTRDAIVDMVTVKIEKDDIETKVDDWKQKAQDLPGK